LRSKVLRAKHSKVAPVDKSTWVFEIQLEYGRWPGHQGVLKLARLLRCQPGAKSPLIQKESNTHMNISKTLLALALGLAASTAFAQQSAAAPAAGASAPQPWTYKTKQLSRAQIDALLAKPQKVVVLDVRRPDELISKGSFPVYLTIQFNDLEKNLAYIPKDRAIITVSNRAHRAGAAGDLLTQKGYKVAGAAGTLDYEDQGGVVARITAPAPKAAP
jgi:rhodanese-related sulfurtransferase